MAFIADTYLIWHGEDRRTPEDHVKNYEPVLDRIELKPGDIIPLSVPPEVQQKWADTIYGTDALGNELRMAHEDSSKEAPEKQEGPPRMELPVSDLKKGVPPRRVLRPADRPVIRESKSKE